MAERICTIPDCSKIASASRGWCSMHYTRWQRFGDPNRTGKRGPRPAKGDKRPECSVEGCTNDRKSRGWCQPHYNQWRRDPEALGQPIKVYRARGDRDHRGYKFCRTCEEWRPETAFASSAGKGDGLQSRCRSCNARIYRGRAELVRDKMRAQRFGVTREQFDALLESQGGRCAICKSEDPGISHWHMDHDHACCPNSDKTCGNCNRGILCSACNMGLGLLRDDTGILLSAVAYLEHHAGNRQPSNGQHEPGRFR